MNRHLVDEIMISGIAKLAPSDKISVALTIFKENIFHSIPIVEQDRLVGIVTTYDIITNLMADKEATSRLSAGSIIGSSSELQPISKTLKQG